jgi:hypothetical protein
MVPYKLGLWPTRTQLEYDDLERFPLSVIYHTSQGDAWSYVAIDRSSITIRRVVLRKPMSFVE